MRRTVLILAAALSIAAAPVLAQGKPTTAGGAVGAGDRAQLVLDVRKDSIIQLHGWARSSKNRMDASMTAVLSFGMENGASRICASAEGVEWQETAATSTPASPAWRPWLRAATS